MTTACAATAAVPAAATISAPAPAPAARAARAPGLTALLRAGGGARYALALTVDAVGSGLLRPFLLLYGVQVFHLGVARSGLAMTIGLLGGLAAVPFVGRWIDRGARSAAVAASMLVRVLGVAALVATPLLGGPPVVDFTAAALFLGVGGQCWPPAHAALVSAVAEPRHRDAALATGRSLRNAGLGIGALIATATTTGGADALRALALATALGYLLASALVLSMRIHGEAPAAPRTPAQARTRARTRIRSGGGLSVLDVANLPYAFCFNVLEVALPAFLVTTLHVSSAWSAGIFVGNTVLVVACQVAVVLWLARFARGSALAGAGLVLALSYLGFWAAGLADGIWAGVGVALVSVVYTAGEIMYTGTATALIVATTEPARLGAALARFQLSSGVGLAASPAVLTALLAWGPGPLWGSLAAVTAAAALAIRLRARV
ncbi:MFS transporter [Streptacidiphilus rugosus]|uniref:MFS transporter n=1 Tax=Streptacidiphilus rugosus TaxID=405783 RepID=UPI0009FD5E31|nr:MFS transporter [Streptacidiphilus rugosus]